VELGLSTICDLGLEELAEGLDLGEHLFVFFYLVRPLPSSALNDLRLQLLVVGNFEIL
jgi:hypothetical protein